MQGTTFLGGALVLQAGDGQNPEGFTTVGGFKSRNFARSAATNKFMIPDEAAPDSPVWDNAVITSLSGQLDLQGFLEAEYIDTLDKTFEGGIKRNFRFRIAESASALALVGRTYQGAFLMTKFDWKGDIQKPVEATITLVADGAITRAVT